MLTKTGKHISSPYSIPFYQANKWAKI